MTGWGAMMRWGGSADFTEIREGARRKYCLDVS
eukprot:CAMPEP_0177313460 /NCGR_PEP_ID=MMETSP0368-20130122/11417_1 /TAXON_ID=447022 ORGANISM="Scrippsiella hangoei-like, Strain SHHI-4" /NCGR_SAMPLE_ID=MMETSP0368 /ASSEMBLY_ACC=CAM_ASM_000363 /LENGTH=32 /DNA_ID= /DNA_START= /DNA_END= /DNA_ORIENTATION=